MFTVSSLCLLWVTLVWLSRACGEAREGGVRPLVHLTSHPGDNIRLLLVIVSLMDRLYQTLLHPETVYKVIVLSSWQIQTQLNKALDDMSASLCTLKDGMSYTKQLPPKGLSQNQVLEKIKEYKTLSKCWFICLKCYCHCEARRSRLCIPPPMKRENLWFLTLCHCRRGKVGERPCVRCCVLGWWNADQSPSKGASLCISLDFGSLGTGSQGWTWTQLVLS